MVKKTKTNSEQDKKLPLANDVWNLGPFAKKESTQKIKDELRENW
ncbi:Uncharacterised protein [uncultured archaeon]|nr:Uncharacterised protein [uncultured archaeon]